MDAPSFRVNEETPSASLAAQRVAIIGLGLMGGSLALALRGKCAALLGVDTDPDTRALAVQRGVVDRVSGNPAELLPQASLVVLAAPVGAIMSLVADLPALHPGRAVVIDLGSTKVDITAAMLALPERLSPVGGHPMCGKESSSLALAEAGLYQDAPFALTALANSAPRARSLAEQLVAAVGARPVWLDPQTHDRWVAATSHLPYLLANALAYTTPIEAAPMVASGFRSTTRLAPASRRMMLDILLTNQGNILTSLQRFQERLERIESALAAGDAAALQELLDQGALRYEQIIRQDRSEADFDHDSSG
jgi:prephenate dehydrogenase